MYGDHFSGFGMWFFWIILIVVVFIIIKAATRSDSISVSRKTPMDILKERYARGDIDEDEFHHRKQELEK